jgi:hypothetical protein
MQVACDPVPFMYISSSMTFSAVRITACNVLSITCMAPDPRYNRFALHQMVGGPCGGPSSKQTCLQTTSHSRLPLYLRMSPITTPVVEASSVCSIAFRQALHQCPDRVRRLAARTRLRNVMIEAQSQACVGAALDRSCCDALE